MKPLLVLILIAGLAACAGCTARTPELREDGAAAAIPDLTGNWTGSLQGHVQGAGYIGSNNTISLCITGQKGRIFDGTLSVAEANGSVSVREIAGAISRDGKGFTLVQSDSGYDLGTVISANEIELVYISGTAPATIVIDSFKRGP